MAQQKCVLSALVALLAVSFFFHRSAASGHIQFAVSTKTPSPALFTVADASTSADLQVLVATFCLAFDGEPGVCEEQLKQAFVQRRSASEASTAGRTAETGDVLQVDLSDSRAEIVWPDTTIKLFLQPFLQRVEAGQAGHAGHGALGFGAGASPTALVSEAASTAARLAAELCAQIADHRPDAECVSVLRDLTSQWRSFGISTCLAHATSAASSTKQTALGLDNEEGHDHGPDLYVGIDSGRGMLLNTALLIGTAWDTFFAHHLAVIQLSMLNKRRRRGQRLLPYSLAHLTACSNDLTGCSVCGRCFRSIDVEDPMSFPMNRFADYRPERRLPRWVASGASVVAEFSRAASDGEGGGAQLLERCAAEYLSPFDSAAQHRGRQSGAATGFLGLRLQDRWMMFIDGKDHARGPFAYERESPTTLPAWFTGMHGPNGTTDLWQGNSSYIGLFYRAYDRMLSTCAMPLSVELVAQLWIWVRGFDTDPGSKLQQPVAITPYFVHTILHNGDRDGGSRQTIQADTMLRGFLVGGGYGSFLMHHEIAQQLPDALNDPALRTNGSIAIWNRLVQFVDSYHEELNNIPDGSEEALVAVCRLVYRLMVYHPFMGGNSRVATLLLHRELTLRGFHPVLLFNTNANILLDARTFGEWVALVKEGLATYQLAIQGYMYAGERDHERRGTLDAEEQSRSKGAPPSNKQERGVDHDVSWALRSPWTHAEVVARHVHQFPHPFPAKIEIPGQFPGTAHHTDRASALG